MPVRPVIRPAPIVAPVAPRLPAVVPAAVAPRVPAVVPAGARPAVIAPPNMVRPPIMARRPMKEGGVAHKSGQRRDVEEIMDQCAEYKRGPRG